MDEKGSRGNYFFIIVKFFLFLLLFSFLVAFSREFYKEVKSLKDFNLDVFFVSILSCFMFYIFLADLNNIYKGIQSFFFHSSQLSFFIPPLLILLGIGYLVVPKIFNVGFNKEVFLFLGAFVVVAHLIYVARETKGTTFGDFINYIFLFSIMYIISLILFEVYLKVAFNLNVGKINFEGARSGADLLKSLFTQIFQK